MGVETGIIRKAGSWFTYGDNQLGQGKENARNFLLANPGIANEIDHKIRDAMGMGEVQVPEGVNPVTGEVDPSAEVDF